jgi:diguanylate cyclase (GGDEF)-like protein
MIVGALLLAGPVFRVPDLERPALLDAAVFATASGFAVWLLLINPLLADPGVTIEAAVVSAAYPILDVLLIAVVARHLLINGPKPLAVVLLAAGLASYLVADLLNVAENLFGTYNANDAVNAGWLLGYIVMPAGVLHPSMRAVGTTDPAIRPMSLPRKLLIATAAVFPAGVILVHDAWSVGDREVLGVGSAALVGLVLVRMFGALRDQQQVRVRMAYQAMHDPLTGLANRSLFGDRLPAALASTRLGVGLLFMDLDGFKVVNDTLGHGAGDDLLRGVAGRLQATLRAGDSVARIGGDEFAAILEQADSLDAALTAANRVLDAMGRELTVGQTVVQPRISIGVTWAARDTVDPDELLRRADVAMYQAKASGGGCVVYDRSMDGGVGHDTAASSRPAFSLWPEPIAGG